MKIERIYRQCIAAITAGLLLSCTKHIPKVADTDPTLGAGAYVQVFDAAFKSTGNYVYVDGKPVSGSALTFGGVFPATAFAFKVNAGDRTFVIKDTAAATKQVPLTFTQTMETGNSYTIFTYDTITGVKQVTVTNNITIPTDTSCMLRFANFIYSAAPVANVDVYSYRKGTVAPLFSNVATAAVTNFIPFPSGQTDTLYIYATGTTAPLQAKFFVTSLTPTRSYTAAYAGSYKLTKSLSTFATY